MGVPHFFKWLARKYKSVFIQKSIDKEEKIDNTVLLLDNNGLIHPRTSAVLEKYPDWAGEETAPYLFGNDKSRRDNLDVLEKHMCNDITEYMKKVYSEIRAKYLYIAIDGPVPMAKMHQQRLRRYKAISEKKALDDIKKIHGRKIPNYWPNANITPGTEFMNKVNIKIKNFIRKNNFDNAICVFSTSDVPGEGEHKIFLYLKKNRKLFENKIKIIYGLDADLIFLSLASGFKHIFLMREYSELDKLGNSESFFNYVDIDKVRECIIKEMIYDQKLTHYENEQAYLELNEETKQNLINDFVFVTFLIGNDFLPNIWCLDVMHRGEDKIINAWKTCYKELTQNLIIDYNINFIFFGMFINILSLGENNYYSQEIFDFMNRESKMKCQSNNPYDIEMFDHLHMRNCSIYNPFNIGKGEISLWRHNYYKHYFNISINTVCYKYIEGLQWIIHYYFNNTPISWTWFYEYLASPLLVDLDKYLKKFTITFNFEQEESSILQGPLQSHIQCLCVLPPQLSNLLIKELQCLVTDPKSKIIHMFPKIFREDRINKTVSYKCMPIIPAINLRTILEEVSKIKFKEPSVQKIMRYEPELK